MRALKRLWKIVGDAFSKHPAWATWISGKSALMALLWLAALAGIYYGGKIDPHLAGETHNSIMLWLILGAAMVAAFIDRTGYDIVRHIQHSKEIRTERLEWLVENIEALAAIVVMEQFVTWLSANGHERFIFSVGAAERLAPADQRELAELVLAYWADQRWWTPNSLRMRGRRLLRHLPQPVLTGIITLMAAALPYQLMQWATAIRQMREHKRQAIIIEYFARYYQ